jgi:hypothetical protein
MNKRIMKTVLLTAALAGTMASCQKEEISSEILVSQEMSQKVLAHQELTFRYWIDGVEYRKVFTSESDKESFISYLISLTHEGRKVTIGGSEKPSLAPEADDKLTIETKDIAVIDAWAVEMSDKGYDVSVSFNEKTGLYTGTATKGGSRTMAANLLERE